MIEQFEVGKLYRKIGGGNVIGANWKIDLNDIVLILKINTSGEDRHYYNNIEILYKDKTITILQPPLWWDKLY